MRSRWIVLAFVALALAGVTVVWRTQIDRELYAAFARADRVRLRTGGTCHRQPGAERTLAELTDAAAIRALAARLHVRAQWLPVRCRCCGNPTLELYRGTELLAELGVHHNETLRWPGHGWADAVLTPAARDYLLRWFAELNYDPTGRSSAADAGRPLRILTWNIQKGEHGLDQLIAELRQADADILCLQEVIEPRSGGGSGQAAQLAAELGMYVVAHGDRLDAERDQALVILSRRPLRDARPLFAPATARNYGLEATVSWDGWRVQIVCVHLAGTWRPEWEHVQATSAARLRDWSSLLEKPADWFGPVIVAGDFNTLPGAPQFTEFAERLRVVSGTEPTYPGSAPALCLDYVLASPDLTPVGVTRPATAASDHLPVVVELTLAGTPATEPSSAASRR